MRQKRILAFLFSALLCVLLATGCGAKATGTTGEPGKTEPVITEILLEIPLEEGESLTILSAEESSVLFAVQKKQINEEHLYAFWQTMRVGIYDLTQKAVTSLWTPQEPAVYQEGCLLGNGTTLCSAALDYTSP